MLKSLVSDISIIELGIYVFIELFSVSMLIISSIKEVPNTRASSIIRSIYLIPGMIAAAFMAQTGQNIIFNTMTTKSFVQFPNGTLIQNMTSSTNDFIPLQNPVWGYFHLLIMFVLFIFIINQIYNLLTKPE